MLFKIISFCFQRFREGCRKRQFFFEMSPLLINCVSEVLSCQRVYSGEVFKILLLLQIKPGKCTEMYLKILSTNVKAESDNSLRDQCYVLTNHWLLPSALPKLSTIDGLYHIIFCLCRGTAQLLWDLQRCETDTIACINGTNPKKTMEGAASLMMYYQPII